MNALHQLNVFLADTQRSLREYDCLRDAADVGVGDCHINKM